MDKIIYEQILIIVWIVVCVQELLEKCFTAKVIAPDTTFVARDNSFDGENIEPLTFGGGVVIVVWSISVEAASESLEEI